MDIMTNSTAVVPVNNSTNTTDTFDFEAFLASDFLAAWQNTAVRWSISSSVGGIISFTSSAAIIYHIIRSHKGLSSTYHRLVFGLCLGDLTSSFFNMLSSTMLPKEMSYMAPWAKGNLATCSLQGVFLGEACNFAALYNCSICLYYVSIVVYNKNDEYIKRKLEPWFHCVSALVPIVVGTFGLSVNAFNAYGISCSSYPHYPPHCIGLEEGEVRKGFSIPCGRGDWLSAPAIKNDDNKYLLMSSILLFPIVTTPIIIAVTMTMMYQTVQKLEKKLNKFGMNTLRVNVDEKSTWYSSLKDLPKIALCCCIDRKKTSLKSNKVTSQKRSIFYMAFGYAMAWLFTYLPYFMSVPLNHDITYTLAISFTPLQGFFNLLVYMAPKVRSAKKNSKHANVNWFQAIARAWKSKGEKPTNIPRVDTRTANAISMQKSLRKHLPWIYNRLYNSKLSSTQMIKSSAPVVTSCVHLNRPHGMKTLSSPDVESSDNQSPIMDGSEKKQGYADTSAKLLDKEDELKRRALEKEGRVHLPPTVGMIELQGS